MNKLSLVIPVLNEAENIDELVTRIDKTCKESNITYELLFIDDHSTDKTKTLITSLAKDFPITFALKEKKQGKAQSIIEGAQLAKYPIIGFIDADLQYPPEAIPEMLKKIEDGADLVVANRTRNGHSPRDFSSKVFYLFFCKFLHNFSCDVQSGLKLFRKDILERKQLSPKSQWMFDLELLLHARNSGYTIDTVTITFANRKFGSTKVKILSTAVEMAASAVLLKFKGAEVVSFSQQKLGETGEGFNYKGKEFIHYTQLALAETAFKRFTLKQKLFFSLLIAIMALFMFFKLHIALITFFSFMTFLYFTDLLFYLYLANKSFFHNSSVQISPREIKALKEDTLPLYTILCPLYKEWEVIENFIGSISALNYPKDKLQVILLLEEDDEKTILEAKKMQLPKYFEIVVVPHSYPKTKPKALNYGLRKAKGEFIVVFDAEDAPEADQLKKAILAFRKLGKNVLCIQAKLNYYNAKQNLLTRLFSLEYSLWFDLILPGLQAIEAPIPLGGTSNHFRLENVKKLFGWDPFNVTEDADLGIRIYKNGYKTAVLDAYTYEEATSEVGNWIKQRTRWIKGYIQTYFVHIRKPREFSTDLRNPHILTFHLIIGGKITSLIINPLLWLITILYFVFRPIFGPIIESLFPPIILYFGCFVLLIGNFLYIYFYFLGAAKKNQWDMIPFAFLVPFYWLLISYAALHATIEFLVKPHYWNKTKHGRHIKQEQEMPTQSVSNKEVSSTIQITYA